jgi:hypothetical protein
VVRGDAGTIKAHIDALTEQAPALLDAYRANSVRLIDHARASGRIDDDTATRIQDALR